VAVHTIFPFIVNNGAGKRNFVELPYTLPQDFTLFVILQEKNINIWRTKLDWIAQKGGMALLNAHPDYMNFDHCDKIKYEQYPVQFYRDFIMYIKKTYENHYWIAQSEQIAAHIMSLTKE